MENKPISIIIEEAKQKIIDVINETKLSPTILEFIVRDLYNEVSILQKKELERDKQKYEEFLQQQNEQEVEE